MDHLDSSMHISEGERDEDGGDSFLGIGEGICIRAGPSRGGETLERNFLFDRYVFDEIAELVLDTRSDTEDRTEATSGIALLFLVYHRRRGVMTHVRHDREIRFQPICHHPCTIEPYFFLDAIYDMQTDIEFFSFLFE